MAANDENTAFPTGPVLVTGGSGFVGGRLVERLLGAGRRVKVLCRRPQPELQCRGVEVILADLSDADAVRRACAGVDTVFHVAARVGMWGPEEEFRRINVEGTKAVLAGCREHEVARLVYTSTPSVVFNGADLAGADESLPYGRAIPSPYAATKAQAEQLVLAADVPGGLATVAIRPHLVWGVGDRYLVPRVVDRAARGRLRIVGTGSNRVDLTHVENVIDAHLLAERALTGPAKGKAYFISNGEPVVLWDWINGLLRKLDIKPVERRISLAGAQRIGAVCEGAWRAFGLRGEPPMTRFIASELAKDHWFSIDAAQRDLGYVPRISMDAGLEELVPWLREQRGAAKRRE